MMASSNEMEAATALTPASLVAYQDGAVVSRTLIKRGGGTMTLFAFDEGQALSDASITVAGAPATVRAGQFILLPANQPHAVAAVTRFKMLLTMIRATSREG
jgi:quercetin dioxygenase-like cupin family protein